MLIPILPSAENTKIKHNIKENKYISKELSIPHFGASSLEALDVQNRILVNEKPAFNPEKLSKIGIPNFALVGKRGIRGESLSSKKNRKFLIPVKKCGIETIIDLRDKYASKSYDGLCQKTGLKYYNFPTDSSSVDDRTIINNLPEFFKIMDNDTFYIACAQGLHRTDIALAINYIFNPNSKEIPEMKGHMRDYGFKSNDIIRRINSIKKSLNKEDLEKLNWDESFSEEFIKRKKQFIEFNSALAKKA